MIIVVLLIFSIIASVPGLGSRVHAAITGQVCLADPTSAVSTSPCPASAPVFAGPIGQQIRIGVYVQGSDALNGFDIALLADHTRLVPIGVDLTGTVLPGTTTVILECLQDVLKAGSVCAPTDTVDTLHFVATAGLGSITTPPTNGLFFTAIYNITGTTTTGITVGYQTGCTGTSVSGGVCVTVSGGSTGPDTETVQAATFNNSGATTMPYVSITGSPTSFGPEFPGTSNMATITATAVNGYPSFTSPDGVTFKASSTTGLTATLSASSCLTSGTSCSVTVSLSANAAGNYTTIISGIYATSDASGNPDTLAGVVSLQVVVDDFGLSISPTSITFFSGATGTTTITLSSLNHFAGTVSLVTGSVIPTSPPLAITYGTNPVTLSAGQTLTSTATFSATVTTATTYHAIIRATSGTRLKNGPTLTVAVGLGHLTTTTLGCTPATIAVNSSSTCTATVMDTNTSPNAVGGTVAFTSSDPGSFSPGATCTLVAGTTVGTATCQVSYTPNALGSGSHVVTGSYSGDINHAPSKGTAPISVSDFALIANPSSLKIAPGGSLSSSVTVTGENGFGSAISLTAAASSGLTATVVPSSVTGSGAATLTVSVGSSVAVGSYTANVTGVSGSLKRTFVVVVRVLLPDFNMTASPSTVTPLVKAKINSTITFASVVGFTGTVTLTLATPATVSSNVNSTSFSLSAGGTVVVVLTVNATSPGTFLVNVTATSGSHSHTVTVKVIAAVPSFDIGSSSSTLKVGVGVAGTSTVSVTGTHGFAGAVALTVSTNSTVASVTCGLSVLTVTGSGTSTLTCTAVAVGTYNATVTGTSGSVTNSTSVIFSVYDFGISPNPSSLSTKINTSTSAIVTIAAIHGFTGTVTLTTKTNSTSLSCSLTSGTITNGAGTSTLSCQSALHGGYSVNVTAIGGGITHIVTLTVTVADFLISASSPSATLINATATSTITVIPVQGFTGTVTLAVTISPSTGMTCTLNPTSLTLGSTQTSTLSCSATIAQNYSVSVSASSQGLVHSQTVNFQITDFTIAPSNAKPSIAEGSSGSVVLTVTSQNGFSGTVQVSAAIVKSNVASALRPVVTLESTSVTLTPDGSAIVILDITVGPNAYPTDYAISANATVGGLVNSVQTLTLTVPRPDFTITAPTAAVLLVPAQKGSVTINVTATNGYNGSVTFAYSPSPSGLTCTFSRSSVNLLPGGMNSTILTCSGSSNLYAVTVTGTAVEIYDSGITKTAIPVFSVIDFAVSATPTGISVNTDQTGHAQINVTWTKGYGGTVTLTATSSSSALTATIPGTLAGSGHVTLDVVSSTAGTYTVVVNATSHGVTHSVTITVTVIANVSTLILGLEPAVFYSIIGVVIVAIIGGVVALARRAGSRRK